MPQENPAPGDITLLLRAWQQGDQAALDSLLPEVYPRLHTIAEAFMRRERPNSTLQATGLVNELYLALLRKQRIDFSQRSDFFAFAAWIMRMILREHARGRQAGKRGGDAIHVPLSEDLNFVDAHSPEQMIDVDRALEELKAIEPRGAQLLELKSFLGCSTTEAGELLGISRATADRALRFSRAWLYERLTRTPQ
ncbi:MAG: sigma-70 family RNA polymerase sigma factor [Bryobacterales bacterium]|nr:sigma-70 family RNA polymerase sigma factor [Bryobacterales bacterium]